MTKWHGHYHLSGTLPVATFVELGDVASSISVIPMSLDTPAIKSIRSFLDEYDISIKYRMIDDYGSPESVVTVRKIFYADNSLKEELLNRVFRNTSLNLWDASNDYLSICGQRFKWQFIPEKHRDVAIGVERQSKGVCTTDERAVMTMRKLANDLDLERASSNIVNRYNNSLVEDIIYEYAWDLTPEELSTEDLDKFINP